MSEQPRMQPLPAIVSQIRRVVVRLENLGDKASSYDLAKAANALEAYWMAQWENRQ